ncbi:MAG: hypothetical protein IPN01_18855 [Deltaproteobacteria bacterium]|nr:hypothetical protein [Deltaproteobacteria bacterium]
MDALLVFCEGKHDIVFAQRSYGAIVGLLPFDKTIAELPSPFGSARPQATQDHQPEARDCSQHRYNKGRLGDERSAKPPTRQPRCFISALWDASRDQLVLLLRCGTDAAQGKVAELC